MSPSLIQVLCQRDSANFFSWNFLGKEFIGKVKFETLVSARHTRIFRPFKIYPKIKLIASPPAPSVNRKFAYNRGSLPGPISVSIKTTFHPRRPCQTPVPMKMTVTPHSSIKIGGHLNEPRHGQIRLMNGESKRKSTLATFRLGGMYPTSQPLSQKQTLALSSSFIIVHTIIKAVR